jgi:hypothetical protein
MAESSKHRSLYREAIAVFNSSVRGAKRSPKLNFTLPALWNSALRTSSGGFNRVKLIAWGADYSTRAINQHTLSFS